MSRNLKRIECHGVVVVLDEKSHPITRKEAGRYYDEFEGMLVAKAHCPVCGAKYLAWIDESTQVKKPLFPRTASRGGVVDLSYFSTFNDEPGVKDLGTHMIG